MGRWVKRYIFFILGSILNAFGVAFITKGGAGDLANFQYFVCDEPTVYQRQLWHLDLSFKHDFYCPANPSA